MTVKFNFNSARARNTLGRLREATQESSKLAALRMAQMFCDAIEATSPEDTGRYKRGWQDATNKAAASIGNSDRRALLRVGDSRHFHRYVEAMEQRLEKIEEQMDFRKRRLYAWYTSKGRDPDKWSRKEERTIAKIEQRAVRQREELVKLLGDRKAIVMDAINPGKKRRVATVRLAIYGGEGRIVTSGGRSVFELVNKEPHSRIVENRFKTMSKAATALRSFGLRRIRRDAFTQMLTQAAVPH